MQITTISSIFAAQPIDQTITTNGWIRTYRRSKHVAFIELTDGTCSDGLQLVVDPNKEFFTAIEAKLATGASISATGKLVNSQGKGQSIEVQVDSLCVYGEADAEAYPLQKKGHTLEFLREQMHLRPRTNTFGAVFRIRSAASFAVHKFYQERGFFYVNAPIVTTSDCEGAGEMFHVTTLPLDKVPLENSKPNFKEDFFGEKAGLTVSGQLEAECFATALSKVYTFGPTFRAENSNTTRHLAEFWMIEPEVAFNDLEANMQLAEDFVKYVITYVLENNAKDLEFLAAREWAPVGLIQNLEEVSKATYKKLDYTDAIKILEQSGKTFDFPVKWGIDLQTEHERYLTDEYVKGPVFVVNYPKDIKAFYMRLNDDGKTVRAMDLLVPRLGEIIGGSQREERLDKLEARMTEMHIEKEGLQWYLDLRRYGTVPHSGFGLGFERLVQYITGMQNIRDVAAFPRFPGFAKF